MGVSPSDERFSKGLRLRRRREFLKVQNGGKRATADPIVALAVKNGRAETRAGFTVSSKVGNAVVRTRIRRQLRELFRKRRGELPQGVDVVFIARASAKKAKFQLLASAFGEIARQLNRSFP